LIPNPIAKVLSTIGKHRVRALLMGGQACVLYGAAEFSRDVDFALLAEGRNLRRLRSALRELQANVIAVPGFTARHLRRGHAIHFRCFHPDAEGIRIDVMSSMRGVAPFEKLWTRRTTLVLPGDIRVDVLSLPDLVAAKKTQRDKDWPMLRRLVEAHYFTHRQDPNSARVAFWLRELRTPELLVEIAQRNKPACRRLASSRPLLSLALSADLDGISRELAKEEAAERDNDRRYWLPLRRELERLRHSRRD
jgi:hypothetical protein